MEGALAHGVGELDLRVVEGIVGARSRHSRGFVHKFLRDAKGSELLIFIFRSPFALSLVSPW
jgi:hypothetical protein